MSTRYLDPKIDLAFKRVFGEHADLLKSFLNALLPLPDNAPIDSLEYLTPEQAPEIPGLQKNSIVDVKCVDTQGRIFIVEMQMLWTPSFEKRILFGGVQAYVKQLKAGQRYAGLQPVYALALLNDIFDHATDSYYHHYQIVNTLHPEAVLTGLEFVFVELPKFKPANLTARKMHILWLRFLSEVGQDGRVPDAPMLADADIASALQLVETAAFTEAELDTYHAGQDRVRVEWAVREDSLAEGRAVGLAMGIEQGLAEGIEQGLAEGIEQGLAEGIEQGLAEGIEQGLAEGKEKGLTEGKAEGIALMVKTMHGNGMSVEQIGKMTQLGLPQVQEIILIL